jgi:hypothetical protein
MKNILKDLLIVFGIVSWIYCFVEKDFSVVIVLNVIVVVLNVTLVIVATVIFVVSNVNVIAIV